jgi:hypothetical protein
LNLSGINPTRNPDHVQLVLRTGSGANVQGVGFNMGPRFAESKPGTIIDLLFQPKIEEFNGRRVKWHVKDFSERAV